jgi:hypothetical protein
MYTLGVFMHKHDIIVKSHQVISRRYFAICSHMYTKTSRYNHIVLTIRTRPWFFGRPLLRNTMAIRHPLALPLQGNQLHQNTIWQLTGRAHHLMQPLPMQRRSVVCVSWKCVLYIGCVLNSNTIRCKYMKIWCCISKPVFQASQFYKKHTKEPTDRFSEGPSIVVLQTKLTGHIHHFMQPLPIQRRFVVCVPWKCLHFISWVLKTNTIHCKYMKI